MGFGALAVKSGGGSEPKFMKLSKRSKKTVIHCYIVMVLAFGMVLAGCTDRESEFLAEIRETETPVPDENPESGTEASGNSEKKDSQSGETGDSGGKRSGRSEADSSDREEAQEKPAEIYVDVCGAVGKPGVFRLKEGSRVFQAIEAAGGYLPEAAQGYINRAEILRDGQRIYVPTKEEADNNGLPGLLQGEGAVTTGNTSPGDGRVNINLAGEEELTTLTGIGAARAKAIIAYREANGPFAAIEDIMKVEGIKDGTFAKIKDEIIVG